MTEENPIPKGKKDLKSRLPLITLLFVIAVIIIVGVALMPGKADRFLGSLEDETDAVENPFPFDVRSAGMYGAPGELNLWKTPGDELTIEVPHEWEIHIDDSPSGRVVFLFDLEELALQSTIWLYPVEDSEVMALSDWIAAATTELGELRDCKSLEVGGIEMTCKIGDHGEESRILYFGEAEENLFVGVTKPDEQQADTPLWEVLNSINFSPGESDLTEALVIP